jgi:polyisoprenoid-binding protein YceI
MHKPGFRFAFYFYCAAFFAESDGESLNQTQQEEEMNHTIARLALVTLLAAGVGTPALAQSSNWVLNSDHSTGRLTLSSTADRNASFDAGIARVKGAIRIDADSLANSSFNFTIYPADLDPSLLNADGSLNTSEFSTASRSTVINFRSKEAKLTGDGILAVTGNLTVSHLERHMTITPSEAYGGPVYGEPEVHSVMREVTFLIPNALAAKAGATQKLELAASTDLKTEDFPGLFEAITDANWLVAVEDKSCEMPALSSEDYQGPSCVGAVVDVTPRSWGPQTIGEDYPGAQPEESHVRDNVTIALSLELRSDRSSSSAVSGN